MYLYMREDMSEDDLPEALRRQVGALTRVMALTLTPDRKLARAEVSAVMARLETEGFYLQMPPSGLINPRLYAGD